MFQRVSNLNLQLYVDHKSVSLNIVPWKLFASVVMEFVRNPRSPIKRFLESLLHYKFHKGFDITTAFSNDPSKFEVFTSFGTTIFFEKLLTYYKILHYLLKQFFHRPLMVKANV